LSYYIGDPADRRRGVGTTAVTLAIRRGFGELGLRKIWTEIQAGNVASRRVCEQLGFREEGTLRAEFLAGDVLGDTVRYGLLAEDFDRSRA
jgi:RimJ/RimL family protein N-acetyltransferase